MVVLNISLLLITSILFASNVQETTILNRTEVKFKVRDYNPSNQYFYLEPKSTVLRFKFVKLVNCLNKKKEIIECENQKDLTPENYFPELLMKQGGNVMCEIWGENIILFKQVKMMQTFIQCNNEIFVLADLNIK